MNRNNQHITQPMKMTTRTILLLGIAFTSVVAMADDSAMQVAGLSSDGTTIGAADVNLESHIRFSGSGVEIYDGETLQIMFGYDSIECLIFRSAGIDGIAAMPDTPGNARLRVNPVETSLEIICDPDFAQSLRVTDIRGNIRAEFADWHGESVDVSSLPPGLYFATINDSATLKFLKK